VIAAYAAIPSTNGTIHGCYRISNPAKGARAHRHRRGPNLSVRHRVAHGRFKIMR
jgi:hypothetical protein